MKTWVDSGRAHVLVCVEESIIEIDDKKVNQIIYDRQSLQWTDRFSRIYIVCLINPNSEASNYDVYTTYVGGERFLETVQDCFKMHSERRSMACWS